MKVQSNSFINSNSITKSSFKGLHVMDLDAQKLLLRTLKPKQLEEFFGFIKEQQENSVHILLDSKNGKRLDATLLSAYRLQDFKTKYKQKFLFESKFDFIKRIVNVANEYKKQIQNFEVIKLRWDYSMLPEWRTKLLSNSK